MKDSEDGDCIASGDLGVVGKGADLVCSIDLGSEYSLKETAICLSDHASRGQEPPIN